MPSIKAPSGLTIEELVVGSGGSRGAGGAIPPNATPVFEVELLAVS